MEEQTFKLEDLVKFGNYLLSKEREELIGLNHQDPMECSIALHQVHDADIVNCFGIKE